MDVPRRVEACRGIPTQKDRKQALLAARVAGEDSVDPREISSELLVQEGGRRRQATPRACTTRKQARKRQDQRYKVAVVVFATLLQFCRRPEQSADNPLAEGEERDAEEL
ncbi:hypothetical protein NDU88_005210 [Pleurodeles waltl]|uniref:Uncharacterized protein n=1 Tax=Pleurodeles waltl TaxID=8319 RepID=A0AAV7NPN3_PLEWA|nr:hypothetical protein NDU88_005210 [Pleurodeles waltl]